MRLEFRFTAVFDPLPFCGQRFLPGTAAACRKDADCDSCFRVLKSHFGREPFAYNNLSKYPDNITNTRKEVFTMTNELFLAIDPGFDSFKVVANGRTFKFPSNVIETDERKMADYNLRDDFMLYKDSYGATYRVGQYARELVYQNKDIKERSREQEEFYTEQRFTSGDFQVSLRSAIALALKSEGLPSHYDGTIYVIVALPHSCRTRYTAAVIGAAAGKHSFTMRLGQDAEQDYQFNIDDKNVMTVSQTIASILGETSDDHGKINRDKFFYLSNGPTLVLDGGYYTMGIVEVSKGGSVDDTKTESDIRHAMRNVNSQVAREVRKVRSDIEHYQVEYLISQNEGQIRYMQDGKAQIIDLNKIRAQKVRNVCTDFCRYLDEKYNNLLDVRYVLVTGGTGSVFYPYILEHLEQSGVLDKDHVLLASGELCGISNPIEFSIVVGAYKGLMGKLNK